MTDDRQPLNFVRPRAEEPPVFNDNRASIQPISDVVADLPPMAPAPKPDVCPVMRTVTALLIPQVSMQFNAITKKAEQVQQFQVQLVGQDNHEWRWLPGAGCFFCIFCKKWADD